MSEPRVWAPTKMATYDQTKTWLRVKCGWRDSVPVERYKLQGSAAVATGLAITIATSPATNARTFIMAHPGPVRPRRPADSSSCNSAVFWDCSAASALSGRGSGPARSSGVSAARLRDAAGVEAVVIGTLVCSRGDGVFGTGGGRGRVFHDSRFRGLGNRIGIIPFS